VKHQIKILVVDDQHPILHTYLLILRQQGYSVAGAPTYSAALDYLKQENFDLLLCDFGLDGGRTGIEVIDVAQARQPGIVSCLLTGYLDPKITQAAEDRGVQVLFKPVQVGRLLQQLRELVRPTQVA
jgi:DNA-binding NtrC family response regulator